MGRLRTGLKLIGVVFSAIVLLQMLRLEGMSSHSYGKMKLLFVDFDKTCSTQDTTGLLYRATKRYREGNSDTRKELDMLWKQVSESYMKGYLELVSSYTHSERILQGFDKDGLESYLKALSDFDKRMSKEVVRIEVLEGIDRTGIEEISSKVFLYENCTDVLKKAGDAVRIISLNWSTHLIAKCLGEAVSHEHIVANHILESHGTDGENLVKKVGDAFDKRTFVEAENAKHNGPGVTIFVGDSPSDFLGMLASDIGILVRPSKSSEAIASRFGILLRPLDDFRKSFCSETSLPSDYCPSLTKEWSSNPTVLYSVISWREIEEFLKSHFL